MLNPNTTRRPRRGVRLTDTQHTTLRQIARGLSTRQIAAESVLSSSGAHHRVRRLYLALGAHHRAEAVLLAVRNGHTTVDELLGSGER